MQLFKLPPPPTELVCQPEQKALEQRQTLLDAAEVIKVVKTQEDNEQIALTGSAIRKLTNDVESARKELTAPYLSAQRAIKKVADDFCAPLLVALDTLGNKATVYRQAQERKAETERQARAAEIARLQEAERAAVEAARKAAESNDLMASVQADIQAQAMAAATTQAIAAPEPEATKTSGQAFQARTLGWECTDINALWANHPELCNPPTPKASAIRATCDPERPVPGLRLWWESKLVFKAR